MAKKKKQEILKEEIDGHRVYLIGNEKFISVTSVFKCITAPALALWEERIGKEIARKIAAKAADTGTQIHTVCENIATEFMGGKKAKTPKKFTMHGELFRAWLSTYVEKIVLIEQVVFSKTYLLAGQLDYAFVMKASPEKLAIADIKTGRVKPIAELQMASYGKLLEESYPELMLGLPIGDRIILPVPRNPKGVKELEHLVCPEPIDSDFEIYLALLQVWRWQEKKEKLSVH